MTGEPGTVIDELFSYVTNELCPGVSPWFFIALVKFCLGPELPIFLLSPHSSVLIYLIKEQLKFCGFPETLHLISTLRKEKAFGNKSALHEPSQIAHSKET